MGEVKIAIGDEVRVHFHPAGAMRSYCEGVVSRVDVTTPEGRFFVVEVMHEVLLDREHRIRRGFPDFVRYECRNDFPDRIEVLSAAPDMKQEPAFDLPVMDPREEAKQGANEPSPVSMETHAKTEVGQRPEAGAAPEPPQDEAKRQSAPARDGLIATLFGRKERCPGRLCLGGATRMSNSRHSPDIQFACVLAQLLHFRILR
jgi:hypothetical protein